MKKKINYSWIIRIFVASIVLSVTFSLVSELILADAGYVTAFVLLLVFILLGVVTDMLGVAVTSAVETPFHSMASHNAPGAVQAIRLIKSAERVSSICNDVIGDICGIVSGATAAAICINLVRDFEFDSLAISLAVTGLVAGLTIGGKALGKTFSINNSTNIVLFAGKIIAFFERIFHKK